MSDSAICGNLDIDRATRIALATVEGRKGNPLVTSGLGGRLLSASQLPAFMLLPPRNYGVLTTTGRTSGKRRRRCVRAVRDGDRVFLVAIRGAKTGWLKNALANEDVGIRIRGGRFEGRAYEIADPDERLRALEAYSEPVGRFEHLEYRMWRPDKPTPERIRDLHRTWFERGAPLAIALR